MRFSVVVSLLASAWLLVVAAPARAEQQAFAVLPTQSAKDDIVDAELVANVMRAALQEQGLTLLPADAVTSAAQANETACQQSRVACARLVGKATGAGRVVASELFHAGAGYELRVLVVDVNSGAEPGAWRSFKANDRGSLGLVAQQAVVQVARPEAFYGRLTVTMSPGAEVIVDGVARDRTPLFAPLQLSVGRHEVEVRSGRLVPWRGFVTIGLEQLTTITLCAPDDAVTDRCGPPRTLRGTPTTSLRDPLLITGGIATAVGAVGLVVGTIAAGGASGALQRYANGDVTATTRDAAQTSQAVAIASFVVGGIGFVGGVVTLAVSTMVE
jgi:hypothetical protein